MPFAPRPRGRLRIALDMRPPRALPAAHFDRNERYAYFGDRTLRGCRWCRAPDRRCTRTRDHTSLRGARNSSCFLRFDRPNDVFNRTPAEIVTPCPQGRGNSINTNLRYTRGFILLD